MFLEVKKILSMPSNVVYIFFMPLKIITSLCCHSSRLFHHLYGNQNYILPSLTFIFGLFHALYAITINVTFFSWTNECCAKKIMAMKGICNFRWHITNLLYLLYMLLAKDFPMVSFRLLLNWKLIPCWN